MKYGLFILLSLFMLQACDVEDKGNYDYIPVNGVAIEIPDTMRDQRLERNMDTLRINPEVKGDIYGENEENYEYKWFFCSGNTHQHTVVGTEKNLEWPVSFKPGSYVLYFQIIDKSTGLEWLTSTSLTVFSELTQGWLLLGEVENQLVRLDMLAIKADGSFVLAENIFDNSELQLKGAKDMIYAGRRAQDVPHHLWVMTEEKDMKLTWGSNFLPLGEFHEMLAVEEMEVSHETPRIRDMFPRQTAIYGSYMNTMRSYRNRGIVTDKAIYMTTVTHSENPEIYVNPMNRYEATSKEFFKPYPMAFVLGGAGINGNLNPLFYDMDAECFVKPVAPYGSSALNCVKLVDRPGDPFPWNQNKRTIVYGENLINSTSDYVCNCAALMKDKEGENINHYVYTFRPPGAGMFWGTIGTPTKVQGYTIDKTVAIDFDKATHYTFASRGNVLLYSVGSILYAYDYSYKTLTSMDMGKEICCISGDFVRFGAASYWVATYDESSGTGELRYLELGGANKPELIYDEEDCWPVTLKIKKIEWKYGDDPAEEEPEEEGK